MSEERLSDAAFDRVLITAAFSLAAAKGWHRMSIAEAAREAELPLDRARERFPGRGALLLRFGRMADQAALADAPTEGSVRDRLFDLIMRRIDVLQVHRGGVLALFHSLPADPGTALLLNCANRRSLAWMLNTAGVPTGGIGGHLRVSGLLAAWLWTVRAWRKDENVDLSHTMAALDNALSRAERLASWLDRPARAPARPPGPATEPTAEPASASAPDVPAPDVPYTDVPFTEPPDPAA